MLFMKSACVTLIGTIAFVNANPIPDDSYGQHSGNGCQLLANTYPQLTSFPGSTEYQARIVENWSEICLAHSSCVFEPTRADDVAEAIKILVRSRTKFAVRGGGHMPNPGAAAIEDGVLISTNRLNKKQLVAQNTIAQIGPGLRWGAVYGWLSERDLYALGGRYAPVGVPGLLLGGGISYFGSRHGWAANNIVNMQVVLADGSIVNANATSNPDLFWALKGGSNNFGIVTRFDIKTYPFRSLYGGTTVYNTSSLNEFLEATAYFCLPTGGSSDIGTHVNPSLSYSVGTGEITILTLMSHEGNDPNPAAVSNFTKLPHVTSNNSIRKKFAQFSNETAATAFSDRSSRQRFLAMSLKASPESVYLSNQTFFSTIESMPALKGVNGIVLSSTHQTITADMLRQARNSGGDPMDLDPAEGNFIDAKDDALIEEFNVKLLENLERNSKAQGLFYDFNYLNDSPTEVRVFDSYGQGRSSLQRLRSIARRYDPNGVFQTLMPGGFKVFY